MTTAGGETILPRSDPERILWSAANVIAA
jgi:hypothetical protein